MAYWEKSILDARGSILECSFALECNAIAKSVYPDAAGRAGGIKIEDAAVRKLTVPSRKAFFSPTFTNIFSFPLLSTLSFLYFNIFLNFKYIDSFYLSFIQFFFGLYIAW